MAQEKPKIIVICGPTGIGKTAMSIELAQRFNGEIVGADSMQIYKYMDIGTAKPTAQERAQVPHHLVDFVDPAEPFDAVRYAEIAEKTAMSLIDRGKLPIVAGGTGLYIKSLIYGIFEAEPVDRAIRRELRKEAEEVGSHALHERLKSCDPEAGARIHPNDAYRIIRALETFAATGKTLSEFQNQHRFAQARFDALKIGLFMERERLYERIDRRVDLMIQEGLLDEVKGLLERGYSPELKAMQSLGYRHMADYLQGAIDWEEALRTLKRDTRRYAKRQLTWFRADPEICRMGPDAVEEASGLISKMMMR